MSEPTPAENEDVTDMFSAWQDHPGEPEGLPGRALIIVVALAVIILVAAVLAAAVFLVAT